MRNSRLVLLIGIICLASCWAIYELGSANTVAHAQQSTPASAGDASVFRAETRLVLVDTVVTDKKGNYVRDLAQNDFKVWEDNKEQPVSSFSTGADAATQANGQRRYLILFFDNSTMAAPDQIQAR